jgi:pyruvate-ferredoxin/flavodoxin oxidoreductase
MDMTERSYVLDGNEAAARIAHLLSEVIAIYPITPSSTMGELADAWSAAGQKNLWGMVPEVIEMQSEAGAAGAVHGSLQAGALTTTFTASQGLLLKLPNMFKIAGELTPTVFHIAARTLATHALSIFGDHSDVMSARTTGFALLASSSVQEAQDMAMIAHMATLKARVPFLHFFDGFRTSHEVNKIELLFDEDARALIDEELIKAHRARALNPDAPVIRGTAQNPDVFFQAREACNPFYIGSAGRRERGDGPIREGDRPALQPVLVFTGAPDAERVHRADGLRRRRRPRGGRQAGRRRREGRPGRRAALPAVRCAGFRGGTAEDGSLDRSTRPHEGTRSGRRAAVPGRRHGAFRGWPQDMPLPRVIGGRYGLSSKEYTPAMAKAALDELTQPQPKRHFTVGIIDDVTRLSLKWDEDFETETQGVTRAVFYGLGADGTVGATKNTVKIIGESRRCTRRATSSTTARSRARSPCRTCASGRSRSNRPT